jgi:hypothetical protein
MPSVNNEKNFYNSRLSNIKETNRRKQLDVHFQHKIRGCLLSLIGIRISFVVDVRVTKRWRQRRVLKSDCNIVWLFCTVHLDQNQNAISYIKYVDESVYGSYACFQLGRCVRDGSMKITASRHQTNNAALMGRWVYVRLAHMGKRKNTSKTKRKIANKTHWSIIVPIEDWTMHKTHLTTRPEENITLKTVTRAFEYNSNDCRNHVRQGWRCHYDIVSRVN